jgi:hypothetical protein
VSFEDVEDGKDVNHSKVAKVLVKNGKLSAPLKD